MKCLCCGKELKNTEKQDNGWHRKCIRSFFGTEEMPEISLDEKFLEKLAEKTVNKGLTVPGVQKKLSLHLDKTGTEARLTLVDYPTGYILKPASQEYAQLPEAEHLAMTMARATGIAVVPFGMLQTGEDRAYITKRVDRLDGHKYAMEDFCQLSGRSTADKYKGSYEECGKIIKKYSSRRGLDMTEIFLRLIFCDMTGNSDMHLKNFSLIETEPGRREFVLSPAYDLLPVNIIMPSDKEFTALTLNGKKRNLRRNDFLKLAENMELSQKAANKMIDKVLGLKNEYERLIDEAYVSDDFKERFLALMNDRMRITAN